MTPRSKKNSSQELADEQPLSQSSNATISIQGATPPAKQKAKKRTRRTADLSDDEVPTSQKRRDSKFVDTPFAAPLTVQSLPKREHPQRKRRKTEKARTLSDDEDSDIARPAGLLSKREHPRRKRRKAEKAKPPNDDEDTDAAPSKGRPAAFLPKPGRPQRESRVPGKGKELKKEKAKQLKNEKRSNMGRTPLSKTEKTKVAARKAPAKKSPVKALPKRNQTQRKTPKKQKEKEVTEDEESDASFTLLTDNEKNEIPQQEEESQEASDEDGELGDELDSDAEAVEEAPVSTAMSTSVSVNSIQALSTKVDARPDERDICVPLEEYGLPIYIYKCLKRSDPIVFDLCQWERRHNICVLVSDEDETDMHMIPKDATYLIIGDYVIEGLSGSVIFFASKINEYQPDEKYVLKVGFYYESYRDCLRAWVDTVVSPNTLFPNLEYEETVRVGGLKFRALYADMKWAADLEFWSRSQRPVLKKFVPYVHKNGTRRRSRVITNLDLVFHEDDEELGSDGGEQATGGASGDLE